MVTFNLPCGNHFLMTGAEMECACTIAGSDSGGGAGIQADLKTFSIFGLWGVSVITAVTAQNPRMVRGTWVLPSEAVGAQMDAVFSHFPVKAAKTGMLGSSGNVKSILKSLPRDISLVVDPVMVATSGARLIGDDAMEALIALLIPRAQVITPNIPEAETLSGLSPIRTIEDMCSAGELIRDKGAAAVVVKGGHLPSISNYITDVLIDREGQWLLEGPRYPYRVHGGGCTFSAAITALIAKGTPTREAAHEAKTFTLAALKNAYLSAGGLRSSNPGI